MPSMGKAIKHPARNCREAAAEPAGALAESSSGLPTSDWANLAEQSPNRMLEESSDFIAWTWLALRMIRAEPAPVYLQLNRLYY